MSFDTAALEEHIKEVLEEEAGREDKICDDIAVLLQLDVDTSVCDTIVGYPSYPMYKCVAAMLKEWMETTQCPALNLPEMSMVEIDQTYIEQRLPVIASVTPLLTGLKSLWQDWTKEEIKFRIREVLVMLGKRGIMDLLGMRKTEGSQEKFPPPRRYLLAAFCERAALYSGLSKGTDMLKDRQRPKSWWGKCPNGDMMRNRHAEKKFAEILDTATSINVTWQTFQTYRLAIRQKDGYGAEWSWWENDVWFLKFLDPNE